MGSLPAVFDSEAALIEALATTPERFEDRDMVVIRYEGPRGAPGMPELLDPTSRITALCRRRGITIALMTDARFSGGSVGLVIGHRPDPVTAAAVTVAAVTVPAAAAQPTADGAAGCSSRERCW
ncbi:MAG: dihydroxy-acid dehydratase [Streptosporangiaceae bacterium]